MGALAASGIADGQQTISINPWKIPPQQRPYADMEATVGDTVEFVWKPHFQNLYIHPSGNCDTEGRILLGDKESGFGSHTFTADDAAAGTVTFTCDIEFGEHDGFVGTHCTAGQIITFNVVDAAMKAVEVATEAPQAEIDGVATEAPQAETEDSTSSEPTLA